MIKLLPFILLLSVSAFAVDLSTVGEINFKIGYDYRTLQQITVDKIVKISSRTCLSDVIISSGYTVALGTSPECYFINVNDLRMPLDDTRYSNLKSFIITFIQTNIAHISYYYIEAHKCRWASDQRCGEVQTWEK